MKKKDYKQRININAESRSGPQSRVNYYSCYYFVGPGAFVSNWILDQIDLVFPPLPLDTVSQAHGRHEPCDSLGCECTFLFEKSINSRVTCASSDSQLVP